MSKENAHCRPPSVREVGVEHFLSDVCTENSNATPANIIREKLLQAQDAVKSSLPAAHNMEKMILSSTIILILNSEFRMKHPEFRTAEFRILMFSELRNSEFRHSEFRGLISQFLTILSNWCQVMDHAPINGLPDGQSC